MFSFSIIIPVKPNTTPNAILSSLTKINYPLEKIEVFTIEGNQPAVQRNIGAKGAKGDILYFFDNDSVLDFEVLNEVSKLYLHDDVVAVGGPDLAISINGLFQMAFDCAFKSYFAHGPMRARYIPVGKLRETSERELIGCNLSIKNDIFKKLGGFNETLYPNEENEFLNRLKLNGYKVVYSPQVFTYRKREGSIFGFILKLYKYGRGRAKQILKEPLYLNWLFSLPFLFSIYLLILILYSHIYLLIPVVLYGLGALISASIFTIKERKIILVFVLPIIYLVMHISYAFGMFSGFLINVLQLRNKGRQIIIKINKVKEFGIDRINSKIF